MDDFAPILRLDDIDATRIKPLELRAAQLARDLGYQIQWHVVPVRSEKCDPALITFLGAGDGLWLHGVHHKPQLPHSAEMVLQAVRRLSLATGYEVAGFSVPFGYVPPLVWRASVGTLPISLLAPPLQRPQDQLCVDVCAWPGPALRNMLQIYHRARVAMATTKSWGLAVHPGRIRPAYEDFALRATMAFWQETRERPGTEA